MIPNPDFFEDLEPYKMTAIGAVGLELWSMSDNIYFDNMIVTCCKHVADDFADRTWKLKQQIKAAKEPGIVSSLMTATEERPWLWVVYVLVIGLPIIILFLCCRGGSKTPEEDPKKTDEATPDDPHDEEETEEKSEEAEAKAAEEEDVTSSVTKADLEEDEEEEEEQAAATEEEPAAAAADEGDGDKDKVTTRKRKPRRAED